MDRRTMMFHQSFDGSSYYVWTCSHQSFDGSSYYVDVDV